MRHLSFLFFLAFILNSCSKASKPFEILYPLIDSEVDYCCFSIEWEDYEDESNYKVIIAEDSLFQDVFHYGIVEGNSYEFEDGLKVDIPYYLKIMAVTSEIETQIEFRVKDYASIYEGNYNAKRRWHEVINGAITRNDVETVEINIAKPSDSNGILINGDLFHFFTNRHNPDYIGIYEDGVSDTNGWLYFNQDSIAFQYRNGNVANYNEITTYGSLK